MKSATKLLFKMSFKKKKIQSDYMKYHMGFKI